MLVMAEVCWGGSARVQTVVVIVTGEAVHACNDGAPVCGG
jgi:hypothetical protein